jgi:thiamine pyrophosphokinase
MKTNSARPNAHIFLNGEFLENIDHYPSPPQDSLIIAADGGARHAQSLGWPIDYLVGDLDSLSPEEISSLKRQKGLEMRVFPAEKDQIDFELALDLALEKLSIPSFITVLGAMGGRWDMTMANLLLPAAKKYRKKHTTVLFRDRGTQLWVLNPFSVLNFNFPEKHILSLVPLGGRAGPVSLSGTFKYPLENGYLELGQTLGLSNELVGEGCIALEGQSSLLVSVGQGRS